MDANGSSIGVLEKEHALTVLMRLKEKEGVNRSTLYSMISASRPTVQRRVDELIEAKLIQETQSPTHSRGKILRLTKNGLYIAKHVVKIETALRLNIQDDE